MLGSKKKRGIWVLTGSQLLAKDSADRAICEVRHRREGLILGKNRSIRE